MICGAVLSMRKASSSDDARPGSGGWSTWPTTTATNVLEPFGQTAGAVKREGAVGVGRHDCTSKVPVKPRPPPPTASVMLPRCSPSNSM